MQCQKRGTQSSSVYLILEDASIKVTPQWEATTLVKTLYIVLTRERKLPRLLKAKNAGEINFFVKWHLAGGLLRDYLSCKPRD